MSAAGATRREAQRDLVAGLGDRDGAADDGGPPPRRGLLALAVGDLDAAGAHFAAAIKQVGAAPAQLAWLRFHQARTPAPANRRELHWRALDSASARGVQAVVQAARRELDGR